MPRGDVLLVSLPQGEGREQVGKRPAIAVQTDVAGDPLLVVGPVTSNLKAARFPFSVQVEPTSKNGLTVPSVIMVFQLRAIDKSRILKKLGILSVDEPARVDAELWRMLKG